MLTPPVPEKLATPARPNPVPANHATTLKRKAKAKPAPRRPATKPKPATTSPPKSPAQDFGPYTATVNALGGLKYDAQRQALADQQAQLGRHGAGIDQVYQAYAAALAQERQQMGATGAQAVAGITAGADAATGQVSAMQAQLAAEAGRLAQGRGGNVGDGQATVMNEGLAGIAANRGDSQIMAQGLTTQNAAQDARMGRLGAIAGGEQAAAHQANLISSQQLDQQRTQLAGDEGNYKVGQYLDLVKQDSDRELAYAALGQKEKDSMRDKIVALKGLETNKDIATANNQAARTRNLDSIQSREQIARMDDKTKREYYDRQQKHWDKQDTAALLRAKNAGKTAKVTKADGTSVEMSPAQQEKYRSTTQKMKAAAAQITGNESRWDNKDNMVKRIMSDTGLKREVINTLRDFTRRGWVGPTGYTILSAYFPGGVVPEDFWKRAPQAEKAKMFSGNE